MAFLLNHWEGAKNNFVALSNQGLIAPAEREESFFSVSSGKNP